MAIGEGLDFVWQLFGWHAFTLGFMVWAIYIMPDYWFKIYMREYKQRTTISIHIYWFIVVWVLVGICCSIAATLVHYSIGWNADPIPLLCYCIMVVMGSAWISLYFMPSRVACYRLSPIITATLGFAIAAMVYFFQTRIDAGLLMIPAVALYFVQALITFDYEHTHCGLNLLPRDHYYAFSWFAPDMYGAYRDEIKHPAPPKCE